MSSEVKPKELERQRLEVELRRNTHAVKGAKTHTQAALAHKQRALTNFALFQIDSDKGDAKNVISAKGYMKDVVVCFERSLAYSRASKSGDEWRTTRDSYKQCVQTGLDFVQRLSVHDAVGTLESWLLQMKEKLFHCQINFQIARMLYVKSVDALKDTKYGPALGWLREASEALEQTKNYKKTIDQESAITELNDKVRLHTTRAKSMQMILSNDALLEELLHGHAGSSHDIAYQLVDTYANAVRITENQCSDIEFMANSRLHKIYRDILKDPKREKKYNDMTKSKEENSMDTSGSHGNCEDSVQPTTNHSHEPSPGTYKHSEDVSKEEVHQVVMAKDDCATMQDELKKNIRLTKQAKTHSQAATCNEKVAAVAYSLFQVKSRGNGDHAGAKRNMMLAVEYFERSLAYSKAAKLTKEHATTRKTYNNCIHCGLKFATSELKPQDAIETIESWLRKMKEGSIVIKCYIAIANILVESSITSLSENKYGPALGWLREAPLALRKATEHDTSREHKTVMTQMSEKIRLQTARAKSMQMVLGSDVVLTDLIGGRGRGGRDVAYQLVDMYRKAINIAENNSDVSELAYDRLRRIYQDYFHDDQRAQAYGALTGLKSTSTTGEQNDKPSSTVDRQAPNNYNPEHACSVVEEQSESSTSGTTKKAIDGQQTDSLSPANITEPDDKLSTRYNTPSSATNHSNEMNISKTGPFPSCEFSLVKDSTEADMVQTGSSKQIEDRPDINTSLPATINEQDNKMLATAASHVSYTGNQYSKAKDPPSSMSKLDHKQPSATGLTGKESQASRQRNTADTISADRATPTKTSSKPPTSRGRFDSPEGVTSKNVGKSTVSSNQSRRSTNDQQGTGNYQKTKSDTTPKDRHRSEQVHQERTHTSAAPTGASRKHATPVDTRQKTQTSQQKRASKV